MRRRSPAGWLGRVQLARSGGPLDTAGQGAARRLIAGDVDGALAMAQAGRTSRAALPHSEAYRVLAWAHLVRGERPEAEAAASVTRRMRAPDRLLTVALVVASGGPSNGAAAALAGTQGVLSLVGATRVFAAHDRLGAVLDEIAGSPAGVERAAFEALLVGLVAVGRDEVADVTDQLATLGVPADRYVTYASVLGEQGFTALAVAYLSIAAQRGFADVGRVEAGEHFGDARADPDFEPIRAAIVANARRSDAADGPGSIRPAVD